MADLLPIVCNWNGENFSPIMGHKATAKKQCLTGQSYIFELSEQRSAARHRAYMAFIGQCWASLPEELTRKHPSPDHLRKYALIVTGYCTTQDFVCQSRKEAERTAFALAAMDSDRYAIISIHDCIVRVQRAESQSYRAMGKQRFNESQEAVENYVGELLNV